MLSDRTGVLVVLICVTPDHNYLSCGLAYFMGGLSGSITVGNDEHKYHIKVPEPVAIAVNPVTFSHPDELYKVFYDNN
ncbi:MAG: hypothetical protein F6K50_02705 [Moorea sp. SIO3I7]|nr:hypothetical protein [Moorena sp. SIO3I7]NEP48481.1 hypothetical protein [Moorena sp. SIO3C2]